MPAIEFGLMLQPFPTNFPGPELFEYNRRLIRTLSQGFTTLWAEDHLQLGETATHECITTLSYFAGEFPYEPGIMTLPSLPQPEKRNAPGSFVRPAHVKTWAGEGGLGTTRNCLASVIEHLPPFL
jgi:hypothetical protein